MKGSVIGRVLTLSAWAFALPLLLAAEPRIPIVEPPMVETSAPGFTAETEDILDRISHRAAEAAKQAEVLRTLVQDVETGNKSDQRTLLFNIQRLANTIGEDLCRLHAVSGVIHRSQQTRVDHMTPDIVELGDMTDAALQFLGENRTGITAADYHGFITEIREDALRIEQAAAGNVELVQVSVIEAENNYHIAADYCGF